MRHDARNAAAVKKMTPKERAAENKRKMAEKMEENKKRKIFWLRVVFAE